LYEISTLNRAEPLAVTSHCKLEAEPPKDPEVGVVAEVCWIAMQPCVTFTIPIPFPHRLLKFLLESPPSRLLLPLEVRDGAQHLTEHDLRMHVITDLLAKQINQLNTRQTIGTGG